MNAFSITLILEFDVDVINDDITQIFRLEHHCELACSSNEYDNVVRQLKSSWLGCKYSMRNKLNNTPDPVGSRMVCERW